MQPLNWNDLQAFLAVAQAGQLARAATTMRVDATTMGRRLRRLESQLGATLFEQTRQGQVLTEAGETLLAQVEAMASAAASIGEGVDALSSGLGGTLRISVSEGFGTWFLAEHIPAFVRQHPQLTIDLAASSGFLSPSKREVDIAVMLSRPKAGPVIARKLSDYTLRLYGSVDYLREFGRPTAPNELAQSHRLIGYVPDLIYAPELRYLDEFHPGLITRSRSTSTRRSGCARSCGRKPAWNVTSGTPASPAMAATARASSWLRSQVSVGRMPPVRSMVWSVE